MVLHTGRSRENKVKFEFEDALDAAGFGMYNVGVLATCCLLILAMYLDIFGFSIVLPAAACDLRLTTNQQAMLSAIPLIASANAAGFVLVGEMTPLRHRNRFMFLMASSTMFVQFVISIFALPILALSFRYNLGGLDVEYRPWRLLMQVISLPGIIGTCLLLLFDESPKFLLNKNHEKEALRILTNIHRINSGVTADDYKVTSVYLEEVPQETTNGRSLLGRAWDQTAPLFQPPLLKNSLMIYYILLTTYMTSTGYTMWVPTITNMYFSGNDTDGKSFCEIASRAAAASSSAKLPDDSECDSVVEPLTLYAVMCYSGVSGTLNVLLSFVVGPLGRKRTTLAVFAASAACGLALNAVRIPLLSIALFYCFLYIALVLGNMNSYIVELNPTYLRGMATCLSVVVARGTGFFSVNLIAKLLGDHCEPTVYGFVALVLSGGVVAMFLPPDKKIEMVKSMDTVEAPSTKSSSD